MTEMARRHESDDELFHIILLGYQVRTESLSSLSEDYSRAALKSTQTYSMGTHCPELPSIEIFNFFAWWTLHEGERSLRVYRNRMKRRDIRNAMRRTQVSFKPLESPDHRTTIISGRRSGDHCNS